MTTQTLTAAQAFSLAFQQLKQGNRTLAFEMCQRILQVEPGHFETCLLYSHLTLPGDTYSAHLKKLHQWLKPETYLEIGVETGKTLALAQPPTIAVGVDPEPKIQSTFTAQTQVFPLTSDIFFASHSFAKVTGKSTVSLAFLDGLHQFQQTLRDFMNVEKLAEPRTVVLIHDCLPLNAFTAAPTRKSQFWSGDPWKVIVCLKKYRPDLDIFVIPAQPTGLGVVRRLDSSSDALEKNWDGIMAEYTDMPYVYTLENRNSVFNVIKNEWEEVKRRLRRLP